MKLANILGKELDLELWVDIPLSSGSQFEIVFKGII